MESEPFSTGPSAFQDFKEKKEEDFPKEKKTDQKILKKMTINIYETMKSCLMNYRYSNDQRPLRPLTVPSLGVFNDGFDNEYYEYIFYVGAEIKSPRSKYTVLDLLGKGTFGQVARCQCEREGKEVALKAIKNKPNYHKMALSNEVRHLEILNSLEKDLKQSEQKIIRMIEHFEYRNHLFIVFELLDITLYDVLRETRYNGFTLGIIRKLCQQVLEGLSMIQEAGIIHSDIKPENILFQNSEDDFVKIIDLGSSCLKDVRPFTYIQSRFYRAPEVILGLPYGQEIDMWSFGCLVAELFIGLPLFPGNSDYDQLRRIIETCGNSMPSIPMIVEASNKMRYFTLNQNSQIWFKTVEEFAKITKSYVPPPRDYHPLKTFEQFSGFYSSSKLREAASPEDKDKLPMFLDFLQKILRVMPGERMKPQQALNHPFIKNDLNDFKSLKRREKAEAMLRRERNPPVMQVPFGEEGPGVFGFTMVRGSQMENKKTRTESSCFGMASGPKTWFDVKTRPRRGLSFDSHPIHTKKYSLKFSQAHKTKAKLISMDSTGSTNEDSFSK